MKPREKLLLTALFTIGWIGLWLIGPEDPTKTYSDLDLGIFAAVLIAAFIFAVRSWSQLIQQRDAERLKRIMERRDRRTHR